MVIFWIRFESGTVRICWQIGFGLKERKEPRMRAKFSFTMKRIEFLLTEMGKVMRGSGLR